MLGGALAAPLAFKVIVDAYGIFNEQFPVPFGMVAKEIVSSVSQGTNPFDIRTLIVGLVAGGALAFWGLPALPIGLGLFAPLSNGAAVLIGGLIRFALEKKSKEREDDGVALFRNFGWRGSHGNYYCCLSCVFALNKMGGDIMLGRTSTFSIVGYDPDAKEWGVAVQSKFLAVGALVPYVKAGVGAIASQAKQMPALDLRLPHCCSKECQHKKLWIAF